MKYGVAVASAKAAIRSREAGCKREHLWSMEREAYRVRLRALRLTSSVGIKKGHDSRTDCEACPLDTGQGHMAWVVRRRAVED